MSVAKKKEHFGNSLKTCLYILFTDIVDDTFYQDHVRDSAGYW